MNRRSVEHNSLFFRIARKIIIITAYVMIFGFIFYAPLLFEFSGNSKSLNVLVFAETFSQEAIERFEKKTGIKVNLTYAEIDEQIYARFNINAGEGYDVVNISDYIVQKLATQELLAPLDHSKISFLSSLDKRLMGREFDPVNCYSLPHKWYVYGIVYDKNFFKLPSEEISLDLIFQDPAKLYADSIVQAPYKLCMVDDGRDAVFLGAIYRMGRITNLTPDDLKEIGKLLINQKRWVEAYTVHSAQYFLFSDVTPLALMSSNYMRKILDYTDRFEFIIPQEGSMLIIENLAIPRCSKKIDMATQFIDFMLSDEVAILNSTIYGFNSANMVTYQSVDERTRSNKNLFPDDETFKRLHVPLLPEDLAKAVDTLWLAVGFA